MTGADLSEPVPWTDPDHPDERLDAAYRSGIWRDPINDLGALAAFHNARAELLSAEVTRLRELLYGAPSISLEEWAALPAEQVPGLTRGELDRELERSRAAGEYATAKKRRAVASLTHQMIRAGRSGEEIRDAILAEAERHDLAHDSAVAIAGDILTKKIAGSRHG